MRTRTPRADAVTRADVLRIRLARAADIPALVALENRVFAGDRLSARQWRHHVASPRATILVATASHGLCGAAIVFFHRGHDIARLYSLAVAPEARGQGVGERLLAAAERDAARRGSRRMRLEVRRDNPGAQRLYAQRGFRVFDERPRYYEDGHDALRYEKSLAPQRGGLSPH